MEAVYQKISNRVRWYFFLPNPTWCQSQASGGNGGGGQAPMGRGEASEVDELIMAVGSDGEVCWSPECMLLGLWRSRSCGLEGEPSDTWKEWLVCCHGVELVVAGDWRQRLLDESRKVAEASRNTQVLLRRSTWRRHGEQPQICDWSALQWGKWCNLRNNCRQAWTKAAREALNLDVLGFTLALLQSYVAPCQVQSHLRWRDVLQTIVVSHEHCHLDEVRK
jgi:hypothetical protein